MATVTLIDSEGNSHDVELANPTVENIMHIKTQMGWTKKGAVAQGIDSLKKSMLGEAVSNIPSSAGHLVSNVVGAGEGLIRSAAGGMENLTGLGQNPDDLASFNKFNQAVTHPLDTVQAVGQGLGERYGTPTEWKSGDFSKLEQTIRKDPVGLAADLSALFSGGGSLASEVGLANTGRFLSKAGEVVEPLRAMGKTAELGADLVGEGASALLGRTSGLSRAESRRAFFDRKNVLPAMRGDVSQTDILANAEKGLQNMKQQRGAEYSAKLEQIAGNTGIFDIQPVKDLLENELTSTNYRATRTAEPVTTQSSVLDKSGNPTANTATQPGWDFSTATFGANPAAVTDAKRLTDIVENWGSKPGQNTALGLDTLKRQLDDFYSPSSDVRALTTKLSDKVKSIVSARVPEYKVMLKDYEEASELIKDIQTGTGVGGRAATDTILRKLMSVNRNNFEFRNTLAGELEKAGSQGLRSQIAGNQMKTWNPRGIAGASSGGLATYEMFHGGMRDPASIATVLGTLAVGTPRVVGEFLQSLGFGKEFVKGIVEHIYHPATAQTMTQISRQNFFKKQISEKK